MYKANGRGNVHFLFPLTLSTHSTITVFPLQAQCVPCEVQIEGIITIYRSNISPLPSFWSVKIIWNVLSLTSSTCMPCDMHNLVFLGKDRVKGTISDKKKLQLSLEIKKNTFQPQYVPFFHINLTAKCLFIRFHSWGTERCFSKHVSGVHKKHPTYVFFYFVLSVNASRKHTTHLKCCKCNKKAVELVSLSETSFKIHVSYKWKLTT